VSILVVVAVVGAFAVVRTGLLGWRIVNTVGAIDFRTPLAVPALAESTIDADGTRVFRLDAQAGTSEFADGTTTQTLGFNGAYLGPTIVADRGESIAIEVTNSLDEDTTVHSHGMHLPARMDGGPHQMIAPGETWSPNWIVDQPAATLWYHPHLEGATERQVAMGMAGMVILRDEDEATLPLPRDYGIDDIPVIVQDASITDGSDLATGGGGFVGSLGNQLLVNGTIGPYLEVSTDVVRLRLLNASPARVYNFAFSDDREFAMIASDGGLLDRSLPLTHIQLSPGERAEVLVTVQPRERVVLQSRAQDLGATNILAGETGGADTLDVLELRGADTVQHRGSVPNELASVERYDPADASAERSFNMDETQINDQRMDMGRLDEVVELGATEIWNVRNQMAAPHSFHVHDVQFQVLSIDAEAPPPELSGWKDTIFLRPNTDYRLIMRFDDYSDPDWPYMYHCHLLRHEDRGMMGQFVVVKPREQPGTNVGSSAAHH
jgi:suppressor of ftsI